MSITGKGTKSIRKLPVAQSSITNVGFKVTRALHECSEDQTLIQLSSLTAPSTAVNYSAPSPSEMVKTNILLFQDNVKLTSSLRGPLMKNIAWVPTGASSIKLLFNAEALEIIEILIDHNAKSSVTMVDADSTPISGTLAAGQTDFNLGNPFEVGKYPSYQHGVYIIYIDGQLAYRNTGNSAPGVGVTGDYYEVHAGAGLGTLIRLNSADLVNDRAISAIPSGALVERPNGSQMAVMEALQGQIDALVPTVAALAEVPETNFQGTPNNVDLKAFGDRVLTNEQLDITQNGRLDVLEAKNIPTLFVRRGNTPVPSSNSPLIFTTKIIENNITYNTATGLATVLEAGVYEINGQFQYAHTGSTAQYINIAAQLNGANNFIQTKRQVTGTTTDCAPLNSVFVRCVPGDTLALGLETTNITGISPSGDSSSLSIKWIRP